MSYNNPSEDEDKDDREKTVDQTKNTSLLDGEARKDSNQSSAGDPEFMWFKKWKVRETQEEEKRKERERKNGPEK